MRKNILSYLFFRFKAKRRHGVHSPLVYIFTENFLQKNHYTFCSFFSKSIRKKITTLLIRDLINYFQVSSIPKNFSISPLHHFNTIPPLLPIPECFVETVLKESYHSEENKIFIWDYDSIEFNEVTERRKTLPEYSMVWNLYFMEIWIIHTTLKQSQIFYLK